MSLKTTYPPGTRVRVTQQVPRLDRHASLKGGSGGRDSTNAGGGTMVTTVEGVVIDAGPQKTGSWYAHSKDHKLWLDRLVLKKDDGEIVHLNLDRYSAIDVLGE